MIYSNADLYQALKRGWIEFHPEPEAKQWGDPTSVNLRVGKAFFRWERHRTGRAHRYIRLEELDKDAILQETVPVAPNPDGTITMQEDDFFLVYTKESICLVKPTLAARIEGRSKYARAGLGVHLTAPTVHAGWNGPLLLELVHHGPVELVFTPEVSQVCQLIVEEVRSPPVYPLADLTVLEKAWRRGEKR